jgi:molybdopterin synthase catalytic subunit
MKKHPKYSQMGMIASHLGVVRGTSLNGRAVRSVRVSFDRKAVDQIILDILEMDGIIEVLVEVSGGQLGVGEEIMAVAVGGDTRDHVFPALIRAVDRIKSQATSKQEEYRPPAAGSGVEG